MVLLFITSKRFVICWMLYLRVGLDVEGLLSGHHVYVTSILWTSDFSMCVFLFHYAFKNVCAILLLTTKLVVPLSCRQNCVVELRKRG